MMNRVKLVIVSTMAGNTDISVSSAKTVSCGESPVFESSFSREPMMVTRAWR
jgi:hypothetical protein